VVGNKVKHIIEGETVFEYTDPQLDDRDGDAKKLLAAGQPQMLRRGSISLQSESHPIDFRKIEILDLSAASKKIPKGWTDLLANNDLTRHWQTTGNWKIDDQGVVTLTPRAGEKGWQRYDAYLWLKSTHKDFEMDFEYRVEKRGNSGFYFHVGNRKSPVKSGIEVQIYDSHGKTKKLTDHDSGGVIPGVPPTRNAALPAGTWNRFHVTCKGRQVRVRLNGELVNTLDLDHPRFKAMPAAGAIGFQDHGLPFALRNIRIKPSASPTRPDGLKIKVPAGFVASTVYDVPRSQGSWVSLCVDDQQRLIACDQNGKLHRITLPKSADGATTVETLTTDVGRAQGLLHAFGSLYVMGRQAKKSGLFRLTDTNDDDQYDKVEHLMSAPVGGEHHAHAIILSPDKKSLYVACGNMTRIPKPDFTHWRMQRNFETEDLIPRMPDARGHNTGAATIGGWVARISPDGSRRELISNGYRNQYDIAFNEHGELFTYDSDMEWDIGTPWYRPTRICHVTSGSEFGWRFGTGKWPAYSPDSLPSVIDIGPGSPTGVVFGLGARFPAKYQKALFICDWSYGIIYAVHLQAKGSSYTATKEAFATAAPFPVTDIVVHPNGAMYFAVGGRGAKSALHKISYEGQAPTTPIVATPDAGSKLRKLRHQVEAAHSAGSAHSPEASFKLLSHPDRHIRYAARIAIEKHPPSAWREMVLKSDDPRQTTLGVLALARHDKAGSHYQLLEKLVRIDIGTLAAADQLDVLRVYGVVLRRMANIKSPPKVLSEIGAQLDRNFPSTNPSVNQELCRVLARLNHDKVVAKTIKLLAEAPTQEEQLHYAYCLRVVTNGWTKDLRTEYFAWFQRATAFRGGASFLGFCKNIRKDAIARMPKQDAQALAALLKAEPKAQPVGTGDMTARKFVRNWTVTELVPVLTKKTSGHDFARGRKLFGVTACAKCHRFQGEGGSVGPDLTGLGGRYGIEDILESIIQPSKVISDQYQPTVFELNDGKIIVGYVANYGGGSAKVVENMLDPGRFTNVPVNKIKATSPSPVSMMPPGLLLTCNAGEIQDLVAYLRSGGNPDHPLFKK